MLLSPKFFVVCALLSCYPVRAESIKMPLAGFPVVGESYRFEYPPSESTASESNVRTKPLRLQVLRVSSEGWILARQINEKLEVDPSNPSRFKVKLEEGRIAWYNLQIFAKAEPLSPQRGAPEKIQGEGDAVVPQ